MRKEIDIRGKKELDVYMNPQRQRLLKCMELNAAPMTPKQLSLKMGISAASVTYHLKKLEALGVVELDHTEMIHGIRASYYRTVPVQVNLHGGRQDDLRLEREVMLDYLMTDMWQGFKRYLKERGGDEAAQQAGDMLCGVVYLTPEAARELKEFMLAFQRRYGAPAEGAQPWETALVAYPRREA